MAVAGLVFEGAFGLINPKLQPYPHLAQRSQSIVGLKIVSKDVDQGSMVLEVEDVFSGDFEQTRIQLDTVEELKDEVIFIDQGMYLSAFVGYSPTGEEPNRIIFYTGSGVWQEAERDPDNPANWTWTKVRDEQTVSSFFGCFNGDLKKFYELMEALSDDRYYFPPRPFSRFQKQEIAAFEKPVLGVALYDVNGDGMTDIYAASEEGNRLFLQESELEFVDATEKLNLAGVAGESCSFADVDLDGRADLLTGSAIYTQNEDGTFKKSELLPEEGLSDLLSSSFVDLNADGWPDVLISKREGGLQAFLNSGEEGGAFTDITASLKINESTSGLTGYFSFGDWNNDGSSDIYYSGGSGMMLISSKENDGFESLSLGMDMSVFEEGFTGVGAMGTLWGPERLSLLVPSDASYSLMVQEKEGGLHSRITATNELENEPGENQMAVLVEDLNADGLVDVFTASRTGVNAYHTNRGAGSFMNGPKYDSNAFPSDMMNIAVAGMAAGDATEDGANDLLIGGKDGSLNLYINRTLDSRYEPGLGTLYHARKRYETKLLAVDVGGPKGVVGAKVTVIAEDGRVAASRQLGTNINTGSCSPTTLNIGIREPGKYKLAVEWSDGVRCERPIELKKDDDTMIPFELKRPEEG